MLIEKGKIDFSKMPHEKRRLVNEIASHPLAYQKNICEEDKSLFNAFISFVFFKTSHEEYDDAWARFLSFLGLTPKDKGINMLRRRMNDRMKDILYNNLWQDRRIDPRPLIEATFYQELYGMIKQVLDEKKIVCFVKAEKDCEWNEDSVLYIYKGQTSCHTRKHEMVSATAILTGRNNSEIKLNVEYCPHCKKFLVSYTVYETYREKYGMLLGKLRMDSSSTSGIVDVVLSEYSPLKLNGYSVSQQDGYSRYDRQYILSKVIEKGALLKSEVVRYLEYFINMNGRRTGNEIALSKWKQDLEFVLQYKMSEQDEYEIKHIKKY